jgi:anaerobic magnesium-protoporphyrin IX monomethyl ester cyclase
MRQKVVLYNPRCVFWTMPLALVAVGSALDPARYEVVIVDGRLEPDPLAALRRTIDERTVCVGVTVLTGAPIRDALLVTRAVRAAHPRLPIVWGGWHPSLFPAECLEEEGVTAAVSGQGELTFRELVDRFAAGAPWTAWPAPPTGPAPHPAAGHRPGIAACCTPAATSPSGRSARWRI